MSVKLSIELPLYTAAAIQNGDHDKVQLSRFVIDAVNALPMRLSALSAIEYNNSPRGGIDTDTPLTPESDEESFTVVESGTSGASTPVAAASQADEEFTVKIKQFNPNGSLCGSCFTVVRNSTTGAELHAKLEELLNIPVAAQRLLLNTQRIRHEDTLGYHGLRREWCIHLVRLQGLHIADADIDFDIELEVRYANGALPPKQVNESLSAHVQPSTTIGEVVDILLEQYFAQTPKDRLAVYVQDFEVDDPSGFGPRRRDTMQSLGVKDGGKMEIFIGHRAR